MDAKKLLEKMGWQNGAGLGKRNQGIKTYIRTALKDDLKGVGKRDPIADGDKWSEIFNRAAKNVEIVAQNGSGVAFQSKHSTVQPELVYNRFVSGEKSAEIEPDPVEPSSDSATPDNPSSVDPAVDANAAIKLKKRKRSRGDSSADVMQPVESTVATLTDAKAERSLQPEVPENSTPEVSSTMYWKRCQGKLKRLMQQNTAAAPQSSAGSSDADETAGVTNGHADAGARGTRFKPAGKDSEVSSVTGLGQNATATSSKMQAFVQLKQAKKRRKLQAQTYYD